METINAFFTAMTHGASLVYHDILAVETTVVNWTTTNPEIHALVTTAVDAGSAFLIAHGIPVPAIEVATSAVMSALKSMAANDATVSSIATAAASPVATTVKS